MKYCYAFLFAFLFSFSGLLAQTDATSCYYILTLVDEFGDGWDGASITVTINDESTDYTLNEVDDDGAFNTFEIFVTEGDSISLTFNSGLFDDEIIYGLLTQDSTLIFGDGNPPQIGLAFEAEVVCPSCPEPALSTISASNIKAFTTDLQWRFTDPEARYQIEYDTSGYEVGTGANLRTVSNNSVRLLDLEENTTYDAYIRVLCNMDNDTSNFVGPVTFTTLYANDVGVSEIFTPITACGLGAAEKIEVAISNFGGTPQTLIPFTFSVNGIPGAVSMPTDGLFTGVIGTDSTGVIEFDATFNFSEPGEYEIAAFTQLEGDSDVSNDTTYVTITNIPIISEFPYLVDFEESKSGWTIPEESENPSWEYGTPNAANISNAAGGTQAWVTNLNGPYNDNERSLFLSPCLNFSELTEDPQVAFSLNLDLISSDQVFLELTIDDGETWTKVGTAGTGTNWYNNEFLNAWTGGVDVAEGWILVSNVLEGAAGATDARLRLVFRSTNTFVTEEGIGFDNFFLFVPTENDLATINTINSDQSVCGIEDDFVMTTVVNFGTSPQSNIQLAYQVNEGEVFTQTISDVTLEPGGTLEFTFPVPFNSTGTETFEIKTWTLLEDDFPANDTATYIFNTLQPVPFVEDFEAGVFPARWESDEFSPLFFANSHNNATNVISDNLFSGDTQFEVITENYGLIEPDFVLTFDYRYTIWSAGVEPKDLAPGDTLKLQVSTDCGDTFEDLIQIDQSNHVSTAEFTTVGTTLENYEMESIRLRFLGSWGADDYWLDLDNIRIGQCPFIALPADIVNESVTGEADGRIIINPQDGIAPYTFEWSNGAMTDTLSNLVAGDYEVTVTDKTGCSRIRTFTVDIGVNATEIQQIKALTLAPNPTQSVAFLDLEFNEALDLNIRVSNMMGQMFYEARERQVQTTRHTLDMQNWSNGIYLVSIQVGDQILTRKLVKTQ